MQRKILLIEDDESLQNTVRDLLELNDFEVHAFINPDDALIAYGKERYDLVLCDYMMRRMTGLDFLKIIRTNYPNNYVPFIMITAFDEKSLYREAMLTGADDFINKPFKSADLLKAVDRQLEKTTFWLKRLESLANFPNENPNPVTRVDNLLFYYQFSNPAFQTKYDVLTNEERQVFDQFIQRNASKAAMNNITLLETYEFKQRYYHVTFSPQINKGYTNIYFSEVTQLVEAEELIKKQDAFYKEILDNLPADLAVFDQDRKYRYVNPNGIKNAELRSWIIGKTDEDYLAYKKIGKTEAFFHREKAFDSAKQSLSDAVWMDEYMLPNGSPQFVLRKFHPVVDAKNQVNLVIGYGIDITDRVLAEKETVKSQQQYKSLFESNPQMVFILNRDGSVLNVNQAAIKQLGYPYEELVSHSVLGVFPSEHHEIVLKTIEQCYNNPDKQLEWELVKHKKNGTLIHVHEVAQVVYFDDEEPKLLIVCTDITERKEAEIKLKTLAQELGKQNEDLRRFAYITSHDLRAPVINLNALLNHFDEENPNNPLNADLIQKFKQSASRISDTLNDLLEVTKIKDKAHAEERSNCDIGKCIADCIADNTEKIKEVQATITTDFSQVNEVYFSKTVLNSAFTNLITNAIKYRSKDRPLTLQINAVMEGDQCVIRFTDNGIGMDIEKYRNRLFTLYQRFHPHIEGKGLGLYLVKSQLEALGGSLQVESTEDVGSTFIIHIPLNT